MTAKAKATRTETENLVPSQFTERIQAEHVPDIWPVVSIGLIRWVWGAAAVVIIGACALAAVWTL
jgi:hypothetical protein